MASSIFINPSVDSGSPSTSLIPTSDNTYDLGSSTFRWRTGYFGTTVIQGGALALGATSTDGIVMQNTTASTAGVTSQISPRTRWMGTAYNSVSTLSELNGIYADAIPATAAGTTTVQWRMGAIVNGVNTGTILQVFSSGLLQTGGALSVQGNFATNNNATWMFSGRTIATSPADAQFNLTNNAASAGFGFDTSSDGVMKVRTRAQSGYATVDALGYSVSGVAGASRGAGAVVSLTVVNGIVTAIT